MTQDKIRVTLEFLGKNKKPAVFDITDEEFHKKTLSQAFIDYTVNQLMKSAIPMMPMEVKTNTSGIIKVPSREELETFIKAQPDYEYTFEAIHNHFLGDKRSLLSEDEFGNWDRALRIKVKRVTQEIESKEKGHFEGIHIGGHKKVFKFIKDDGGGGKQHTVEDS